MRAIVALMLCLALSQVRAEAPPVTDRDALISWVLERFWGNARDSKGAAIQPSSDLDRRTVPIPSNVAYRALDAGELSGFAEWCGLDWKSHYLSLTAAARRRGMSDKQVAFISFLHGTMQGRTRSSKMECTEDDRVRVAEGLEVSMKLGLGAPNASLDRGLERRSAKLMIGARDAN